MSIEEKLTKLAKINRWMDEAKVEAESLRREIAMDAVRLKLVENKEGAANTEYAVNGVEGKLTITRKINRTLDQKLVPGIKDKLPAGLFKQKEELVVSAFRKLTGEELKVLAPALKESEGLPVISWEPVKKD